MSDRRRFLKGLTSLPLATVLANPRLAAAVVSFMTLFLGAHRALPISWYSSSTGFPTRRLVYWLDPQMYAGFEARVDRPPAGRICDRATSREANSRFDARDMAGTMGQNRC